MAQDRSAVLEGQKRALELAIGGAPVREILEVLVRAIERHTGDGMVASIQVVEGGRLKHGAAPGLPDTFNRHVDGHPVGPLAASCGTAAHLGEIVSVHDIANDPRWAAYREIAAAHDLAACWSMPIRSATGEVIGTFAHYYRSVRDPAPPDRDAVAWIAHTASIVLERDREMRQRAEAEATLRRQVHDLQLVHELAVSLHAPTELDPTLELVLDVALRLHEAHRGILFLYQNERLQPVTLRGFETAAPELLAALTRDVERRDGRRVVIADTELDPHYGEVVGLSRALGFRAAHRTPIRTRSGRAVGVLVVHLDEPRAPTDLEIQLSDLCAGYAADAVERARAVAEIREARDAAEQANRAKDDFLAILGHELRNPLAPIASALHLLDVRSANDEHLQLRNVIERQVSHLTRIVDDLQDVARIRQGKIQLERVSLDVRDVIARAVEMTAPQFAARQQQVSVEVSPGLIVSADPTRLAQILSNLLVNASKYSDARTTTTVTASRTGATIEIVVRDRGIGLAPDMIARVFDLFAQEERALDRAHGGLGIGLAIVKKLVTLHGGTVAAHSEGLGRGSTFTVELPAHLEAAAPPPSRRTRRRSLRTRKILVVDDNTDVADMMAELLSEMGHIVCIANDGAAALQQLPAFAPEIALLDLGLPVMDGYELARRVRASALRKPYLVAVTGYGRASDQARVHEAGFDAHLVKPVSIDTVLRVIDNAGD